jgi:hypothetical protein
MVEIKKNLKMKTERTKNTIEESKILSGDRKNPQNLW